MFSTQQLEMLRKALASAQEANRIVIQANLPALASGVPELTSGLSRAIAGLTMILGEA
jgi:X-X-X-Leu-X-X-Gly heptad repeat protein